MKKRFHLLGVIEPPKGNWEGRRTRRWKEKSSKGWCKPFKPVSPDIIYLSNLTGIQSIQSTLINHTDNSNKFTCFHYYRDVSYIRLYLCDNSNREAEAEMAAVFILLFFIVSSHTSLFSIEKYRECIRYSIEERYNIIKSNSFLAVNVYSRSRRYCYYLI